MREGKQGSLNVSIVYELRVWLAQVLWEWCGVKRETLGSVQCSAVRTHWQSHIVTAFSVVFWHDDIYYISLFISKSKQWEST